MGIAREKIDLVCFGVFWWLFFCFFVMEVVSAFVIFCLGERWCAGDRFYILLELKVWHACWTPGRDLKSKKIKEIGLAFVWIGSAWTELEVLTHQCTKGINLIISMNKIIFVSIGYLKAYFVQC